MTRRKPKNETEQKRNRLFPCSGLEKLHVVFIKYEIIVAIIKATPLASGGVSNMISMRAVAINTCSTVTIKPEKVKRSARLMNIGCNDLTFIIFFKNTK